jgi:hypothetical protein
LGGVAPGTRLTLGSTQRTTRTVVPIRTVVPVVEPRPATVNVPVTLQQVVTTTGTTGVPTLSIQSGGNAGYPYSGSPSPVGSGYIYRTPVNAGYQIPGSQVVGTGNIQLIPGGFQSSTSGVQTGLLTGNGAQTGGLQGILIGGAQTQGMQVSGPQSGVPQGQFILQTGSNGAFNGANGQQSSGLQFISQNGNGATYQQSGVQQSGNLQSIYQSDGSGLGNGYQNSGYQSTSTSGSQVGSGVSGYSVPEGCTINCP